MHEANLELTSGRRIPATAAMAYRQWMSSACLYLHRQAELCFLSKNGSLCAEIFSMGCSPIQAQAVTGPTTQGPWGPGPALGGQSHSSCKQWGACQIRLQLDTPILALRNAAEVYSSCCRRHLLTLGVPPSTLGS